MAEQQTALRVESAISYNEASAISFQNGGIVLSDHPIEASIHPELRRRAGTWRRFDAAAGEAALLLNVADDNVPYLLGDNVLQHCPRICVALTKWMRAARLGGLVTNSVPDGATRSRRDGERWSFALQELSVLANRANILIELHGGHGSRDSRVDHGTAVTIELPGDRCLPSVYKQIA